MRSLGYERIARPCVTTKLQTFPFLIRIKKRWRLSLLSLFVLNPPYKSVCREVFFFFGENGQMLRRCGWSRYPLLWQFYMGRHINLRPTIAITLLSSLCYYGHNFYFSAIIFTCKIILLA